MTGARISLISTVTRQVVDLMLAIARNPEDELLSSLGTELSSNHTFHEDQPSTELSEPTHGSCSRSDSERNSHSVITNGEWRGGAHLSSASGDTRLALTPEPRISVPVNIVLESVDWNGPLMAGLDISSSGSRQCMGRNTRPSTARGSEWERVSYVVGGGHVTPPIQAEVPQRRPRPLSTPLLRSLRHQDEGLSNTSHHQWRTKGDLTRFMVTATLQFMDTVLRVVSLALYLNHKCYFQFTALFFTQSCAALLAAYITFHDADVLLFIQDATQRSLRLRRCVEVLACLICACCQGIHVKRALTRQFHTAEVFTEFDTQVNRRRRSNKPLPFAAAERTLPTAFIMGVPFLLVSSARVFLTPHEWPPRDIQLLLVSCIVTLLTASMGIMEIDVAVSTLVTARVKNQPTYAMMHVLFRAAEVSLRVVIISCVFGLFSPCIAAVITFSDYVAGVAALRLQSPDDEGYVVHCLVAVGLLVSDLTHFVDQPSFGFPARRISQDLLFYRVITFVTTFAVATSMWKGHLIDAWTEDLAFGPLIIGCSACFYLLLKLTPTIRLTGHDLHTAACVGDDELILRLLVPQAQGQILDVNSVTKDGLDLTPLMIAAREGKLKALEVLVGKNARHDLKNVAGDTALHLAARNFHVEICKVLVQHGADRDERNEARQIPLDMASHRSPRRITDELLAVLAPSAGVITPKLTASAMSTVTVGAQVVNSTDLRGLFPDAAESDEPSPSALASVSALILARSAGLFARRLLNHHHDAVRNDQASCGTFQLGTLRRVRELGQGGFGRVIEVELPSEPGRRLGRHRGRQLHFALKLQHKVRSEGQARAEVLALSRAIHPFIVRLERAFQTNECFALLLELCPTDLNRILCEGDNQGSCLGLGAKDVATYMGQVLLALTFLHSTEVVYRDVKPENVLISEDNQAKLTDFGLAKKVTPCYRITFAGTAGFLAPELTSPMSPQSESVQGEDSVSVSVIGPGPGYSTHTRRGDPYKCDAYSFGVTLQLTLLGTDGARKKEVRSKGTLMLPLLIDEDENTQLCDQLLAVGRLSKHAHALLLKRLLPFRPELRSRLCDTEVMNHPFFLESLGCSDLAWHLMPPLD